VYDDGGGVGENMRRSSGAIGVGRRGGCIGRAGGGLVVEAVDVVLTGAGVGVGAVLGVGVGAFGGTTLAVVGAGT
jgi:hypothetical protein